MLCKCIARQTRSFRRKRTISLNFWNRSRLKIKGQLRSRKISLLKILFHLGSKGTIGILSRLHCLIRMLPHASAKRRRTSISTSCEIISHKMCKMKKRGVHIKHRNHISNFHQDLSGIIPRQHRWTWSKRSSLFWLWISWIKHSSKALIWIHRCLQSTKWM